MATNSPESASKHIAFKISAPGKVILHGEHSVVYDKLALAASLGLRTHLELREIDVNNSASIIIEFRALQIQEEYDLRDLQDVLKQSLPLMNNQIDYNLTTPELIDYNEMLNRVRSFVINHKKHSIQLDSKQEQALTAFFYLFFAIIGSVDFELKPANIIITTDLTISAGTGSSASFSVLIAASLLHYIKLRNTQYGANGFNNKSFDKTQLDLISKWGFQAEKIIHGTPSGVDNTICTYGSLVEFRKGAKPKLIEICTKFNVILINTNVARDTKVQVAKAAQFRNKYERIANGVLELMEEVCVEAVECFKLINSGNGDNVTGYYEKLAELSELNQNLLRCLGVSHPKLDEACQILSQFGLSGKLTGAGGGGYAICLVPPYIDLKVVEKVIEVLNSKGFDAIYTDLGGSGVIVD